MDKKVFTNMVPFPYANILRVAVSKYMATSSSTLDCEYLPTITENKSGGQIVTITKLGLPVFVSIIKHVKDNGLGESFDKTLVHECVKFYDRIIEDLTRAGLETA